MKKYLLCILVAVIVIMSLASCGKQPQFSFSYDIEEREYKAGDCIVIQATITNTSGKSYRYTGAFSDFNPEISLYYISKNNEKLGHIEYEPRAMTTDYNQHVIADGESSTTTYYFNVPEDAACTEYSITLSYKGMQQEFAGVLRVVE